MSPSLKELDVLDLILECSEELLRVNLRGCEVFVTEDDGQPNEIVASLLKVIIPHS